MKNYKRIERVIRNLWKIIQLASWPLLGHPDNNREIKSRFDKKRRWRR